MLTPPVNKPLYSYLLIATSLEEAVIICICSVIQLATLQLQLHTVNTSLDYLNNEISYLHILVQYGIIDMVVISNKYVLQVPIDLVPYARSHQDS